MTTHAELGHDRDFVRAVLPWWVAAAALVVYLLTLNHWISFPGLGYVARAAGEVWTPELAGPYGPTGGLGSQFGPYPPLFYLVSYPVRWLPLRWIPLALNLISAVCASLALGLLARSVALLPHDRTHEQRVREPSPFAVLSLRTAWIPPVFAAAVCGLQLTFWENATSISGDMFEMLLIAYIIRCLLEYRISEQDSWLMKATLAYSAGMTGDWVLIGCLPAFIAALVWLKGIGFVNLQFLRALTVCAIAGLLLYLLLPGLYILSQYKLVSFWQALKVNLAAQKNLLQLMLLRVPKYMLLLMITTSFLPLLLISIRWASYFGDPSKLGIALTTWILHLAHAVLLILCLWTAFDPVFSPFIKGIGLPELRLPIYYLGALCIGYFVGYFLLVFTPQPDRMGRVAGGATTLSRLSRAGIVALLVLVPAGLVAKNLASIRLSNGPAVKQFAALLTRDLPDQAVVLSDDAAKLFLAKAWIRRHGAAAGRLYLDTQSLPVPLYHALLHRDHPNEFPSPPNVRSVRKVPDYALVKLVIQLSEKRPVYYLHPSFGYYFEFFYPLPQGLVYEMKQYPTNVALPPPLTEQRIAANEAFWKESRAAYTKLIPFIRSTNASAQPAFWRTVRESLNLPFEPNPTATVLGRYYSQGLDAWGVQLQRSGRLADAAQCFNTASALNPDNIAARFNLACNAELQAGRNPGIHTIRSLEEEFGKFRSWQQVLWDNGPFDDPTHCLGEGITFLQGRLLREAAQQFERVHQLVPDNLAVQMWLAQFYATHAPDKALALIAGIREHPDSWTTNGIRGTDLGALEATALFASHKPEEAERVLHRFMEEYPRDERLLSMAVQICASFGRITNALLAVNRELELSPTNLAALVAKGYLNLQTGNFEDAIPPLTRVLTLETNNYTMQYAAQLDRAIAYLRANKLDEAQKDYEALLKLNPGSFRIYYGLGEVAWRKKDTNAAIHYYELYLTNCIYGSDEAKVVGERLQNLKAGSR